MASGYLPRIADAELRACLGAPAPFLCPLPGGGGPRR